MNVFLNFDPYTNLDLFHPNQWLQERSNIKEIEAWKVAKKITNVESELNSTDSTGWEQSERRSSHMVNWSNEIPTIYICSEQKGKQQEKRINTREKQSSS